MWGYDVIMLQATNILDNEAGRADEKSFVACSRSCTGSYFGDSTMKTIPLTQGKIAIVDEADYDWLMRWKWYAQKDKNTYYAARGVCQNNKHKRIWMHREILRTPSGMETDHKDGNGLNNCRENLRIATRAQNDSYRRKTLGTSSKYKGVCRRKGSQKWQVAIQVKGKSIYLGLLGSEVAAARVYDKAALKHFGEFALTNF